MINLRLILIGTCLTAASLSQQAITQDSNSERQAVLDAIQGYVDAFNKRSAVAISNHWASDGEFVNADGEVVKGRSNILRVFEQRFDAMPKTMRLSVSVKNLAFVTDAVALEDGIADMDGELSEYTAVHKKENGKWRVYSIRETAVETESPASEKLAELSWLIGEWVDESDSAIVRSSARWSKNRNFITSNVRVELEDMEAKEGTQIIGFDAAKQKIRSWTFDSEGGVAEGSWTRKGNKWMVKTKHTLADGRTATSVNVFEMKDINEFKWSSTKRTMDGESLPDVAPVNVIRLKASAK